jgi:hypothetical protein
MPRSSQPERPYLAQGVPKFGITRDAAGSVAAYECGLFHTIE